jgi:hypothetical protein
MVKVAVIAEKAPRTSDLARNLRIFLNRVHAELHASEYALTAIETELRRLRTSDQVAPLLRKLGLLEEREIRALIKRIDRSISALSQMRRKPKKIPSAKDVLEIIWGWRVGTVLDRYELVKEKALRLQSTLPRSQISALSLASIRSTTFGGRSLNVFISYRREDTRDLAARIADHLERAEPRVRIFRDVASIQPGSNWQGEIFNALKKSHVVLSIIGPRWSGEHYMGRQKLFDDEDWVRYEIECSMRMQKTIIPVVVQGCPFPPRELPHSLRRLEDIQAYVFDPDKGFEHSISRLIEAVQRAEYTGKHRL